MQNFISRALQSVLSVLLLFSITTRADDRLVAQAGEALQRAKTFALEQRAGPDYWNMPLYMGSNYVAQAYLMRFWLAQDPQFRTEDLAPFDEVRFRTLLSATQLPVGSWQPTVDPSVETGTLDATIMNY